VAFGAEYRRERFREIAGEPNSYADGGSPNQLGGRSDVGAQVFPGFRPANEADALRRSVAVYGDLEGDVHPQVRLGLAGRFEHYSDFGKTLDGKLTARYAPAKRLVVRGALSTGFRAPSLVQSHFSSVATNFISLGGQVVPVEVGTFAVESPVARALGATDLRPEQSRHLSGGVVYSPVDGFDLAVDFYRIDIDGRVVFSGNFTGPRIEALVRPLGANGGRFFTNAIDTQTQGLDLTAAYRRNLKGAGQLTLSGSYNRTDNEIVGTIATPPQLAGFENVLFDRVEALRVTCGQPRDNVRLRADWTGGAFAGVVRTSRYGEYCFATLTPANDQTFGPKWLTDLELSLKRGRLIYALGAQNVFDTFPDRLSPANSSFQVQTFPATSPFGFNGRFLYARLTLRL
jgi:iron complex outermembrane receptor protein